MKTFYSISVIRVLIILVVISIFASCQKAEYVYSQYQARFAYSPVSAKPTLFRACTSLGEFCSITYPPGKSYVIKSPSTPSVVDYIQRTALQGYQGFVLGVGGGLIVGLPSIPEMLTEDSQVTCYDLCCSNCYQNYHVHKHLELHTGGQATCLSCNRVYDLNSQGIVSKGDPGRSLFRYYVHYYAPTQNLTINNN